MSASDQNSAAPFRALLGIAESVAALPDPQELLRQIASHLREAVPFDFLGVLLHDPPPIFSGSQCSSRATTRTRGDA